MYMRAEGSRNFFKTRYLKGKLIVFWDVLKEWKMRSEVSD